MWYRETDTYICVSYVYPSHTTEGRDLGYVKLRFRSIKDIKEGIKMGLMALVPSKSH